MKMHIDGNISDKIVIALGFFDSLHIGHRRLISSAISYANSFSNSSVVCTFCNNPYKSLGKELPLVYTFSERKNMIFNLGANGVLSFELQPQIAAADFLQELSKFNISAIFCGEDYRFGRNAVGSIDTLREFFAGTNTKVFVEKFIERQGKKVSTTNIRELLHSGSIIEANQLLGANYSICGRVQHGYKIGRTLGFPTANIFYPNDKVKILDGVYKTFVLLDGKRYSGISNVGCRPTFSDEEKKVETYIKDFSEDIYDRDITIEFVDFLRQPKKFENTDMLKNQLKEDMQCLE